MEVCHHDWHWQYISHHSAAHTYNCNPSNPTLPTPLTHNLPTQSINSLPLTGLHQRHHLPCTNYNSKPAQNQSWLNPYQTDPFYAFKNVLQGVPNRSSKIFIWLLAPFLCTEMIFETNHTDPEFAYAYRRCVCWLVVNFSMPSTRTLSYPSLFFILIFFYKSILVYKLLGFHFLPSLKKVFDEKIYCHVMVENEIFCEIRLVMARFKISVPGLSL